jgi:hypothetical protein
VSPEQIGTVARTWDAAGSHPDRLHAAIVARLPESPGCGPPPVERSRWIVDAVSRLSGALDRPTALGPAAAEVIGRRGPVTLADLGADRDAVLGALRDVAGDFGPVEEEAWDAAFQLFSEVVTDLCLDPFGTHPQPRPPGGTP